jgi:hypothetical protein
MIIMLQCLVICSCSYCGLCYDSVNRYTSGSQTSCGHNSLGSVNSYQVPPALLYALSLSDSEKTRYPIQNTI